MYKILISFLLIAWFSWVATYYLDHDFQYFRPMVVSFILGIGLGLLIGLELIEHRKEAKENEQGTEGVAVTRELET